MNLSGIKDRGSGKARATKVVSVCFSFDGLQISHTSRYAPVALGFAVLYVGKRIRSGSRAFGAKTLHVPYNGLAPYLKDLMGGEIDFAVVPLVGPVLGAIESGRINPLAIASQQSVARLPKLPSPMERIDTA